MRKDDLKISKGLGAEVNYAIQGPIPHKKLLAGSIIGKIPIPLSDGRTIIYARPGADIEAVREKFEKRVWLW